jgi:protein arginine kinase activator
MLCERCSDNEATVHLTQVIDGVVKKLHLCEGCAEDSGLDIDGPMSVTDLILGLGGGEAETAMELPGNKERSCPRCHMRRTDFKKTSRFGCPDCYETFAQELPPLLKAIHHAEQHVGKAPARESVRVKVSAEIARLQHDLEAAVAAERYEEAAKLRDEIQSRTAVMEAQEEEAS